MKKINLTITIIILLSSALTGVAFAKAKPTVAKGTITNLNGSSITIESSKDGSLTVILPAGFDATTLAVGDMVMVKGEIQADGSLLATSVRQLGKGKGHGQGQGGVKESSAFCASGKQDKPHPLAVKIAEKYGVSSEWVTGYYCSGISMGAIMLALKTSQLNGADPASLLAQRASGEGWGKIWQGLGMIGNEQDVKTPPGQLKKQSNGGSNK